MAATTLRPSALRSFIQPLRIIQSRSHSTSTTSTFSSSSSTSSTTIPSTPNSTVNPTEVSHFNALASSWWDPHGPSRLLHLMNPLRHDFITSCRASAGQSPTTPTERSQKLKYLDIGCGGGIFSESAARLHNTASVRGIDPSPEVLSVAQKHAALDPKIQSVPGLLTFENTSIEGLPVPDTPEQGNDVVCLWEVIEHVDAPSAFLEHVLKHVKPGGWLVLSTIARTWTSWAVTKVVAEDVLRIVPRGTHEWAKFIEEKELRDWFAGRQGWGEGRSRGCVYVPGLGWRWVEGGERWGNYFFGIRKGVE